MFGVVFTGHLCAHIYSDRDASLGDVPVVSEPHPVCLAAVVHLASSDCVSLVMASAATGLSCPNSTRWCTSHSHLHQPCPVDRISCVVSCPCRLSLTPLLHGTSTLVTPGLDW